ncbi:MAG: glycosyltransferase family 9 protein [Gemmatimonadota bacterium]
MKPGRVAVFRPGRAGDFILTTPLFNAIKDYSPETHLTVITGRRSAELARFHPAIDQTLILDAAPINVAKLLWAIRRSRFDIWIDPKDHPSRNSVLVASLARAERKIGFNGERLKPFDLTLSPGEEAGLHFSEQVLLPLGLVGIPAPRVPRISLGLSSESRLWAERQIKPDEWTVLVNISAGSGSRFWPVAEWSQLLPGIAAIRPTRFLLSSAPEDAVRAEWLEREVLQQGVNLRRLPGSSLLDLAALVGRVDLVLTVDTSIVHLAAAFDRPVVALYIREFPVFTLFQPRSTRQRVVAAERGAPMSSIPVDQVAKAYGELAREPVSNG